MFHSPIVLLPILPDLGKGQGASRFRALTPGHAFLHFELGRGVHVVFHVGSLCSWGVGSWVTPQLMPPGGDITRAVPRWGSTRGGGGLKALACSPHLGPRGPGGRGAWVDLAPNSP